MWPFTGKSKKRRSESSHTLELRTSANRLKTARIRYASAALGILLATFLVLFLAWRGGSLLWDRLVYNNPALAIKTLDIRTDGALSHEQIRRWAGLKPGQNLVGADLYRIKRELELVPIIKSVTVSRVFPQTICISIAERVPVAQVLQPLGAGVSDQILFTLDENGIVMIPLSPGQRSNPTVGTNDSLPVITGVSCVELRPGRAVDSPAVKAALNLIKVFRHSPMAGVADLGWIDISQGDVIVVTTEHGAKITFQPERLDQQLRRWRAVHDMVRAKGKILSSLDLSVANNIPYTVVDANAVPPDVTKPEKPTRSNLRRKNV